MHRRLLAGAFLLLLAGLLGVPAQAASPEAVAKKKFPSCSKLLKAFPAGIARDASAARWASAADYAAPNVSKAIYRVNARKLDRAGLGVLCPQPVPVVGPDARYAALAETLSARGVTCMVVRRDGQITGEWYWNGRTASTQTVGFSTMKTLTGSLIAIASDLGKLTLDQPASDFITSWRGTSSQTVTVRQLLAMTSGRAYSDADAYNMVASQMYGQGPTAYAIGLGQAAPPGTTWVYSDSAVQTLAAVITSATGQDVIPFAQEQLLRPLGMSSTTLTSVAGGGANMAFDFTTTCRDLSKLTQLYVDSGNFGGRQVISAAYTQTARSPASSMRPNYGLLLWNNTPGAEASTPGTASDSFELVGACGQRSYGFPSTRATITVMTSINSVTESVGCSDLGADAPALIRRAGTP